MSTLTDAKMPSLLDKHLEQEEAAQKEALKAKAKKAKGRNYKKKKK